MVCCGRGSDGFRRSNWAVAISLRALVYLAYSITLPSMHQFVTNPTGPQLNNSWNGHRSEDEALDIVPGLGESENAYAWAVTMYSIGELVGALSAGSIKRFLPYRFCFLLGTLLCPFGFVIYSLASDGWMVLLARFIIGLNCGLVLTFITAYIGETTTEIYQRQLEEEYSMLKFEEIEAAVKTKPKKYLLKDKLYAIYSLTGTASAILPPAIGAVVSHFPSINPYRWTGWFIVAASGVFIAGFLAVFREHKPFEFPQLSLSCWSLRRGYTKKTEVKPIQCAKYIASSITGSGSFDRVPIVLFLYVCTYMSGSGYALVDTLVNPTIADNFGFSIGDSSYFIVGTTALLLISSLLFLILKQLEVDTRKIYIVGLLLAFTGAFLMADWQAIGNDPCYTDNTSLPISPEFMDSRHLSNFVVSSRDAISNSSNQSQVSVFGQPNSTQTASPGHSGSSDVSSDIVHEYMAAARRCELQSTSEHQCFWNPKSRVTGKLCSDCYQVCRSVEKSLNFAQFCLGITLYVVTVPLSTVCITAILSSLVPLNSQTSAMGINFAFAGLARFIVPIWSDALYEASAKHTYLPMGITALQQFILLWIFLALYQKLSPDAWRSNDSRIEEMEMDRIRSSVERWPAGGKDEEEEISREEEEEKEEEEEEKGEDHSMHGNSTFEESKPLLKPHVMM